ncbi:hypothetical protein K8M07_12450 [Schnuerera sp. xch1]|uniref:hypothetical protein n=1 Tax=Schnuerera sp. xch1 TaxID=2874283 RepID=UPI001CBE0FF7|nr:hypothetical protein [Schnuerera sp. xch1]MBZ2176050.1 hypothetical protein [Schnuerera sp. xch1]
MIPNKLIPEARPKILDYFYDKDGNIIGKVGGIFLNRCSWEKEDTIKEFILAIEELRDDNTVSLIIEEPSLLSVQSINLIEDETNLKVFNKVKASMKLLPLVLNSIYERLGNDLKGKEVLIIGDDKECTKKVIESICKDISFITLTGYYEDDEIENIYEYILENTGLSIFYSKNIDRILTNYSIVINLIDNYCLNTQKLRKEAIVFDLSIDGKITSNIIGNSKATIIEDFVFKGDGLNIKRTKFLSSLVYAYIYEQMGEFKLENLDGLYVNGQIYKIRDLVDYKIKSKGKL